MSTFKNAHTGDIVTVFGAMHDSLSDRPEYELIDDDRDGIADTSPQPEVLDDEPAEQPEDPEGEPVPPEDSQDSTADEVGKISRSAK